MKTFNYIAVHCDYCWMVLYDYVFSIHIRVEETISVTAGRDGGLQGLELHGIIKLKINDEKMARAIINVVNNDKKGIQMQVNIQHQMQTLLFRAFLKFWEWGHLRKIVVKKP